MPPESAQESQESVSPSPNIVDPIQNKVPQNKSGLSSKVLVTFIVVIVLIMGAYLILKKQAAPPSVSQQPSSDIVSTNSPDTPTVSPVASEQVVDNNLTALDRDLLSLDAGLSDKQGDLSE